MLSNNTVTVVCPINIALIKYCKIWGKKNVNLNLPLNSSISITLDTAHCFTKTTVTRVNSDKTSFKLNGREEEIESNLRLKKIITYVSMHERCNYEIISTNSFPTAAGMASSASGFAALALCFGKLCNMSAQDIAVLARIGSGSACRSLYGGLVEWECGSKPDGTDSIPVQLYDHTYWKDLAVLTLICSDCKKEYSSTEGMNLSTATSDFLKYRVAYQVDERIRELKIALKEKSFEKLGELIMKESNSFHAICQDTYPPIVPPYLNNFSYSVIRLISLWNTQAGSVKAAYTFDAGPNAFIILPKENVDTFLNILTIFADNNTKTATYEIHNYTSTHSSNFKLEPIDLDQNLKNYIVNGLSQLKSVIYYNIGKGPQFH